jgi:hypothetical protein
VRKQLLVSVLLFIFLSIGYTQNSIEGVWTRRIAGSMDYLIKVEELSRGEIKIPYNFDLIIDLCTKNPEIIINQFSIDNIISVNEKYNLIELTFYFARGGFNVTFLCHFNEDETMWIEDLPNGLTFLPTGKDRIYYKMGNINDEGEFEFNLEYVKMVHKNNDIVDRYNNWSSINKKQIQNWGEIFNYEESVNNWEEFFEQLYIKENLLQNKEEPLNNEVEIVNIDNDIGTLNIESIIMTNIFKTWYLFFLFISLIIFLVIILYIKRER